MRVGDRVADTATDQLVRRRWNDRRTSAALVVGFAVLGGVLAVFAPSAPTGWVVVDAVYRVAFAVLVTVAASEARRWSWFVLAGLACAFGQSGWALAFGAVALGLAFVASLADRRVRRWGAAVGALSAQALLRLPEVGPFGLDGLLVAFAVVPVLVSCYRLQERSSRKVIRRVAVVVGAVVGVGLLAGLVAAAFGLAALDRASDDARRGIQAVNQGEPERAAGSLQDARTAFRDAGDQFGSVWAMPARLLPGGRDHLTALADASALGERLSLSASTAAIDADYGEIGVQKGTIDTNQIAALQKPLVALQASLRSGRSELAAIERDRLLRPMSDRLDLLGRRLDEAIPAIDDAIDAVKVAPAVLGADGPRRYVVAFTTPAEARGIGGFWGFYAELSADQGHLKLVRTGRVPDLNPKPRETVPALVAPPDYQSRYAALHPERNLQDLTFSPDFPTVAPLIETLYADRAGGAPVDGVFLLDPYAMAELLRVTGPIEVPGLDNKLDADTAADFLVRTQYVEYGNRRERGDVLGEFAKATFESLLSGKLKNPARLARVMGPMVEQHRVAAHSVHADEQALFARLGLDDAFPVAATGTDLLAVTTQNAGNNKIDLYLHREIDYRLTIDPATGQAQGTVHVRLVNDAPTEGLPDNVITNRPDSGQPPGVNWTWLSIYTPFELQGATQNGQALPVDSGSELGWKVYGTNVAVPPKGGALDLELRVAGPIDVRDGYRLLLRPQPLVNSDTVRVAVQLSEGWVVTEGGSTVGESSVDWRPSGSADSTLDLHFYRKP